jgi:hypothetical protein
LLNGERRPIPDHRLHPADKKEEDLQSFHVRGFVQAGLGQQRDYVFKILRTKFRLKYGFMIVSESPEGPEKDPEDALGITVTNADYMQHDPESKKSWCICVFINLSQLELLMRDDLNTAERMTIQWAVADTVSAILLVPPQTTIKREQIVHETMHAVAAFLATENKLDFGEPYFEDDALAEVGFSFESIVRFQTAFI